jgi:hypothetical protein
MIEETETMKVDKVLDSRDREWYSTVLERRTVKHVDSL